MTYLPNRENDSGPEMPSGGKVNTDWKLNVVDNWEWDYEKDKPIYGIEYGGKGEVVQTEPDSMTKLSKLGEEMIKALEDRCEYTLEDLTNEQIDEAVQEVALKYIEKAWDAGMAFSYDQTMNRVKKEEPNYKQWLEENGISTPSLERR